MTRLGLLGGSFDPPHYGHLLAAQEAAWRLELERVLWVPARQNPLKRSEPISDVEDRCAMVACAIADNPLFFVIETRHRSISTVLYHRFATRIQGGK